MEKHSPTDDAPRSDEQQEHERDAERLMLQQEAEHLAHAKYAPTAKAGLDGRRVAVPDLAILESCRVIGRPAPSRRIRSPAISRRRARAKRCPGTDPQPRKFRKQGSVRNVARPS